MNTIPTYRHSSLDIQKNNGVYTCVNGTQQYTFSSEGAIYRHFQKTSEVIKLKFEKMSSYLHAQEVFSSKTSLRQSLAKDNSGAWAEMKNGEICYFIEEKGWLKRTIDDSYGCWHIKNYI